MRDSPTAFGSTLESALLLSDKEWQSRIVQASADLDLPLFARDGDRVIGLAWGKIFPTDLTTAHLFQMWVHPNARGFGAGHGLLNTVIDWAKACRTAQVLLSVTIDDSAAWRMYKSAGFQDTGSPEPLREGSGIMSQPMTLSIEGNT